ncbi:MAG: LCP family protein [Mogibacterium sp.]|nr:LCP family protein [Mogibacterium sp.]
MSHTDWDPDDFLDFDYGKPVPGKSSSGNFVNPQVSQKDSEELRLYAELRRKSKQKQPQPYDPYFHREKNGSYAVPQNGSIENAAASAGMNAGKKQKKKKNESIARKYSEAGILSKKENAALQRAQLEAYDRYRSNYVKRGAKKSAVKASAFTKFLSLVYLLALAVFCGTMTFMNVMPFGMTVALYVVLGLLSIIIVMQLRRNNVKKGVRVIATFACLCLIAVYGVGTAYAMGTLSFLDYTSVDNEKAVASITKEPFNMVITGMDVRGTIDEEGRSDVNMLVTVNPETEQILMTSIPRDYQIYMPDKDNAMDKLTHTGFYSVATTVGAEEQLLDTQINYYVKVNFTTVMMFIDAIGGIDVYSEYEFNPVKRSWWTVKEGMNHMNGREALAFARERKAFADGDNQRIKNQQAVFEAMIKKATSSKTLLLSYNKILSSLKGYFEMSFSSAEMRALIKLQLARNPEWKIYKNTIRGGDGLLPTYTTGATACYVMTQDETSITNARELISAVMNGGKLAKDEDKNVYVEDPGVSEEDTEADTETE